MQKLKLTEFLLNMRKDSKAKRATSSELWLLIRYKSPKLTNWKINMQLQMKWNVLHGSQSGYIVGITVWNWRSYQERINSEHHAFKI